MNNISKKKLTKYESLINKGISSAKKQEFKAAEKIFNDAINYNKQKDEAYINLANIYLINKNISSSTKILFNYLKDVKFSINISNYLGDICIKYNKNDYLLELFKISNLDQFEVNQEKAYLFFLRGLFFEKGLDYKNAINSYIHSIKCNKKFVNNYLKLFNLYESTNDLNNYKNILDESYKYLNKDVYNILDFYKCIYLHRIKDYNSSQQIILSKNFKKNFVEDKEKLIRLLDIEAKNNEKLGKFNKAFEVVLERNSNIIALEENKKYKKEIMNDILEKYKKFYKKVNINKILKNENYKEDKRLAFLIGFPRSGTTLLDTILRTHSKITVLEEKPYLLNERHNFFIENKNNLDALKNITSAQKLDIRKKYFENINFYKTSNFIIDKFPLSIVEIGFIKCIFPGAKIILSIRHPCDVVISCFFSLFKINEAMIHFLNWSDTLNFYNNVFQLFESYEKELDLTYYQIKYEDVVTNFKKNISDLLEYLELDYEENLINFNNTAKKRSKILTPSYTQVIKPLYTTSIGRWKNYKDRISPDLFLEKWIKRFNY